MVDIQLVDISEDNKLHKESLKKVKALGALRMVEEDIDELIKEIRRRDKFDEEFNINSNERITYNNETETDDQKSLDLRVTYH